MFLLKLQEKIVYNPIFTIFARIIQLFLQSGHGKCVQAHFYDVIVYKQVSLCTKLNLFTFLYYACRFFLKLESNGTFFIFDDFYNMQHTFNCQRPLYEFHQFPLPGASEICNREIKKKLHFQFFDYSNRFFKYKNLSKDQRIGFDILRL